MNQSDLLDEVAQRAQVSEEDARAVLDALAQVVRRERAQGDTVLLQALAGAGGPPAGSENPKNAAAVEALIERARSHPLGLEYLQKGFLGSVAATFQAHAFTVLAARERLKGAEVSR